LRFTVWVDSLAKITSRMVSTPHSRALWEQTRELGKRWSEKAGNRGKDIHTWKPTAAITASIRAAESKPARRFFVSSGD